MLNPATSKEGVQSETGAAALSLLGYCQDRSWAGWDPYDALNSRLFQSLPFLDTKWPRLVLTQALKRMPINLRPLLLVPPSQNPKGLALFLQALLKLNALGLIKNEKTCQNLAQRIAELRSPGEASWCWGYSFPWQTRNRLVPRGASNLVCTVFVAEALLDYHEATGQEEWLNMALSAAEHIAGELYWQADGIAAFSYPFAGSRVPVHNANFLAAAFLCRLQNHSKKFLEIALKVARYSATKQKADGSWVYGEGQTQGWIDNFHTGFNLCALNRIGNCLGTDEFKPRLARGYEYYRNNFFEADGAPKYFHNRLYPVDVHSAAQSLITLAELRDLASGSLPLAAKVRDWTLKHLRDGQGYFYYQQRSWGRIKIPYMRWGQAWMLLALATVLEAEADSVPFSQRGRLERPVELSEVLQ
jgi:hypothetical protein